MARPIHRQRKLLASFAGTTLLMVGCNALSGASEFEITRDADTLLPEAGSPPPVNLGEAGSDASTKADQDSNPPDVNGPDGGPLKKIVFVTSARLSGALGGLDGADETCKQAASQAGLGSAEWRAWLSTSTTTAISRIKYDGPYVLPNGTPVVSNKSQLASGNLSVPIDVTETGAPATKATDEVRIWTGTSSDGTSTSSDLCTDWTTSNSLEFGVMGSLLNADSKWTRAPGVVQVSGGWGCQTLGRLYCFEL